MAAGSPLQNKKTKKIPKHNSINSYPVPTADANISENHEYNKISPIFSQYHNSALYFSSATTNIQNQNASSNLLAQNEQTQTKKSSASIQHSQSLTNLFKLGGLFPSRSAIQLPSPIARGPLEAAAQNLLFSLHPQTSNSAHLLR